MFGVRTLFVQWKMKLNIERHFQTESCYICQQLSYIYARITVKLYEKYTVAKYIYSIETL